MRRQNRAPLAAWILGLAGLIPFAVTLVARQIGVPPLNVAATPAYFAYCAVILSFLGGVRWGFEVSVRPEAPGFFVLAGAVIPALVGWSAMTLQMLRPEAALGLLMGGFALMWLWDAASSGPGGRRLPQWYPALRGVLTLGVLVTGAAMFWLMRQGG
jgi:Protein of unknown function (DUF3429)